jgi:hypothetical protein
MEIGEMYLIKGTRFPYYQFLGTVDNFDTEQEHVLLMNMDNDKKMFVNRKGFEEDFYTPGPDKLAVRMTEDGAIDFFVMYGSVVMDSEPFIHMSAQLFTMLNLFDESKFDFSWEKDGMRSALLAEWLLEDRGYSFSDTDLFEGMMVQLCVPGSPVSTDFEVHIENLDAM